MATALEASPIAGLVAEFAREEGTWEGTMSGLLAALDDPDINVVCMALKGLGRRGDKSVIDEIIQRLERSDKWYEQIYGYRALRALGWRQKQKI